MSEGFTQKKLDIAEELVDLHDTEHKVDEAELKQQRIDQASEYIAYKLAPIQRRAWSHKERIDYAERNGRALRELDLDYVCPTNADRQSAIKRNYRDVFKKSSLSKSSLKKREKKLIEKIVGSDNIVTEGEIIKGMLEY